MKKLLYYYKFEFWQSRIHHSKDTLEMYLCSMHLSSWRDKDFVLRKSTFAGSILEVYCRQRDIPGDVGGYPVEYNGKRVLLAQIQDWRIPTVRFCPVCALGFQDTPKFPAEMREAKENEGEKRNAPPGSRETCHEQKVTLFSIWAAIREASSFE